MRNYRVYLALFVVLIAIVGALLHPLSLLLGLAPFNTRALVGFLVEVRSLIADLLGWAVLSVLALMVFYVIRGRIERGAHTAFSTPARKAADGNARSQPEVVVALTAYNDAEATAQDVKDFRRQPGVTKVLVIDNNSTDNTANLAIAAGATVVRETQQGYGYACIRGLAEGLKVPGADVIVLCEGDGTFLAEDTAKFLAYIGDADLVVGNRVVKGLVDRDSQMDYFFTWGNMAVAMLIRLRRRVGQSKGASQSFRKGLQVGLVMIWHIITFNLKPAAPETSRPVEPIRAPDRAVDANGHSKRAIPTTAETSEDPTSAGISK